MKKSLLLLICFICMSMDAAAHNLTGPGTWGLALGVGESADSVDIYRAGLLKQWDVRWLDSKIGHVQGYFELSYNRWEMRGEEVNAGAFSPVFQYCFHLKKPTWYPYVEAGVGVACLDEYMINGRNLSSNLVFEDRIGLGFRIENLDISVRYMHYSNADLKLPNDGIDMVVGTLAWYF